MKNIFTLIICTIIISCNGQSSQKPDKMKNQIIINCFLVDLNGEHKIYDIKDMVIYASGKEDKIDSIKYSTLQNPPENILTMNNQFGCGVCTDGVDYKFIFTHNNKSTQWIIQPGYKLPEKYDAYFKLLVAYYNNVITHN